MSDSDDDHDGQDTDHDHHDHSWGDHHGGHDQSSDHPGHTEDHHQSHHQNHHENHHQGHPEGHQQDHHQNHQQNHQQDHQENQNHDTSLAHDVLFIFEVAVVTRFLFSLGTPRHHDGGDDGGEEKASPPSQYGDLSKVMHNAGFRFQKDNPDYQLLLQSSITAINSNQPRFVALGQQFFKQLADTKYPIDINHLFNTLLDKPDLSNTVLSWTPLPDSIISFLSSQSYLEIVKFIKEAIKLNNPDLIRVIFKARPFSYDELVSLLDFYHSPEWLELIWHQFKVEEQPRARIAISQSLQNYFESSENIFLNRALINFLIAHAVPFPETALGRRIEQEDLFFLFCSNQTTLYQLKKRHYDGLLNFLIQHPDRMPTHYNQIDFVFQSYPKKTFDDSDTDMDDTEAEEDDKLLQNVATIFLFKAILSNDPSFIKMAFAHSDIIDFKKNYQNETLLTTLLQAPQLGDGLSENIFNECLSYSIDIGEEKSHRPSVFTLKKHPSWCHEKYYVPLIEKLYRQQKTTEKKVTSLELIQWTGLPSHHLQAVFDTLGLNALVTDLTFIKFLLKINPAFIHETFNYTCSSTTVSISLLDAAIIQGNHETIEYLRAEGADLHQGSLKAMITVDIPKDHLNRVLADEKKITDLMITDALLNSPKENALKFLETIFEHRPMVEQYFVKFAILYNKLNHSTYWLSDDAARSLFIDGLMQHMRGIHHKKYLGGLFSTQYTGDATTAAFEMDEKAFRDCTTQEIKSCLREKVFNCAYSYITDYRDRYNDVVKNYLYSSIKNVNPIEKPLPTIADLANLFDKINWKAPIHIDSWSWDVDAISLKEYVNRLQKKDTVKYQAICNSKSETELKTALGLRRFGWSSNTVGLQIFNEASKMPEKKNKR